MRGSDRSAFRNRLEEALSDLQRTDPRKAQILLLRYFAGLSLARIAQVMDLPRQDVHNEWRFTRAWLHRRLKPGRSSDGEQEINHGR